MHIMSSSYAWKQQTYFYSGMQSAQLYQNMMTTVTDLDQPTEDKTQMLCLTYDLRKTFWSAITISVYTYYLY